MIELQRSLVLDANILVRAVLGKRARDVIIGYAERAAFFAPEVAFGDARKYLPDILTSRGKDPVPAMAVLHSIERVVHAVEEDTYNHLRDDAFARIGQRDPDDWPILATALALHCPIWTEDQDFFGTGVPTWTTDRVELYLDADD